MVLVQKWPFFQLFVLGNIGQENVFNDILKRKKGFSMPSNQEVQKFRKIDIFPNGLTYGFGPKIAIFLALLFRQYKPGKYLLRYSSTKKTPF